MTESVQVLCIIPARSGSKGIPHKNIRPFKGMPLLAHSIKHALRSHLINRVIVSTENPEYAEIAREYGAETPFIRPPELSQDLSTDLEVFLHALKWLQKKENYVPDICVHLRPTYPIRRIEDIDSVIKILIDNPGIDSVRTISPAPDTPYKMWFRGESGFLSPVVKTEINEAYNLPRQSLPQVYLQNACIDAVRRRVITQQNSMTGKNIFGYVMNENYDIDIEKQLDGICRKLDRQSKAPVVFPHNDKPGERDKKVFCFDIDGIVATIVPANDYALADPQSKTISLINALYDKGHHIILFTARGSATGIDWKELTQKQLIEWGVRFHELLFQKPVADYYIDDKMISLEELFGLLPEL